MIVLKKLTEINTNLNFFYVQMKTCYKKYANIIFINMLIFS